MQFLSLALSLLSLYLEVDASLAKVLHPARKPLVKRAVTTPYTTYAIKASVPVGASRPVDKRLVSLATNAYDFPKFAGNLDSPNTFSFSLVETLCNLTANYTCPSWRVGSINQDSTIYNPDSQLAVGMTGLDVSFGPTFFESFKVLPAKSEYVFGLNLLQSVVQNDPSIAVAEAQAIYKALGKNLTGFELGNEPDLADSDQRLYPVDFTAASYKNDFDTIALAVREQVFPNVSRFFTAGSFASLTNTKLNLTALIPSMTNTTTIGTWSAHVYGLCSTNVSQNTISGLLEYNSIISRTSYLSARADQAILNNTEFVVGEMNSVCRAGQTGVSDVFASALWALNFYSMLAAGNVSKGHLYSGNNAPYSAWQPVTRQVMPIFYGLAIATQAFASNGTVQVANLNVAKDPSIATYGIYVNQTLNRLLVVNSIEYYGGTGAIRPQTTITFNLDSVPKKITKAQVLTLTAPAIDSKSGVTYNGISYDTGKPDVTNQQSTFVQLSGKTLKVQSGASEAMLLQLS